MLVGAAAFAEGEEGLIKKQRAKDIKKGEDIGIARTKGWFERKLEAEKMGPPFDDEFPGAEDSENV